MADDMMKTIPVSSTASAGAADSPQLDGTDFSDVDIELRQRFELLPDDIRSAIMDTGYQQKLFDIAKAQKLTYEELGILETETTMVLLGMTKPADYRDELQSELKKNDAEIDQVVAQVNEKVFAPIRASLEKLYSAKREPGDYAGVDPFAVSDAPVAAAAPLAAPVRAETVNPIPAAPAPSLTSNEKSVLEKTGVILSDAPRAPLAASPLVGSLPNRDDLLKSIENPPKSPVGNIVADKLAAAGPVIPAVKATDYSMPAKSAGVQPSVASAAPAASKTDPYREPI